MHRSGAGFVEATVDLSLELRSNFETAMAFGVHDPRQTGIELVASELLITLDLGVVVGKKGIDGGIDDLKICVTHGQ
jgi:hypothetical protein